LIAAVTGKGMARRTAAVPQEGSEALLVPHVGHGALFGLDAGRRERVLAAGDHVLGTHGELAAPRGAPGQAEAQAFPLVAGLAIDLDHTADHVGAEGAIAATDAERTGIPAGPQAGGLGERYQARPRIRAGDGDIGLRADVLLAEDLQIVLLDPATGGQGGAGGFRSQPGRQGAAANAAGGDPEAVALAGDAGGGAKAATAGLVVIAKAG